MIGRFLLGAGLGGLVGTAVLALVSLSTPLPEHAAGSPPPQAAAGIVQPAPAGDPAPAEPALAGPVEQPGVGAAAEADTGPAEAPAEPTADTAAPEQEPADPTAAGTGPAPADGPAPEPPDTPVDRLALAPAADPEVAAPGVEAAPAGSATTAETMPAQPAMPSPAMPSPAMPMPALPEAPPEVAAAAPAPAGGFVLLPEGAPLTVPSAAAPATPEAAPQPQPGPVVVSKGTAEGEGAQVETRRLPRIGDLPADAAAAIEADAPPIRRYARAFDNPARKPAFAVILIDDGAEDLDRKALAALPFPVSFALDPQVEGVAGHAAIYRAAGQEVIMLATGLPKGGNAQDVEAAFGIMGQALPEAVAVMDLPGGRFQGDRALATLVVPAVAAQGRGIVTWSEGGNAADQVARRAALPAVTAFRNLDGAGEAAPVIRRYLDRAAFKAAQENKVVVVGHTRPETIAALLEWTVEGRAAMVALAPVTAVLTAD